MIFDCETVEACGEDGALDAIGVRWTEARTFCEAAIHKVAAVMGLVTVLAAYGGVMLAATAGAQVLVIVVMAVFVFGILTWTLLWLGWRVPGRVREVTFWYDGVMRAPFGLSTARLKNNESQLPVASIESIEAEQLIFPSGDNPPIYTHGVRIIYATGHISHIARHLAPDQAHMVAVKLTQALAELRKEIPSTNPAGMRSNASGLGAAQLID